MVRGVNTCIGRAASPRYDSRHPTMPVDLPGLNLMAKTLMIERKDPIHTKPHTLFNPSQAERGPAYIRAIPDKLMYLYQSSFFCSFQSRQSALNRLCIRRWIDRHRPISTYIIGMYTDPTIDMYILLPKLCRR